MSSHDIWVQINKEYPKNDIIIKIININIPEFHIIKLKKELYIVYGVTHIQST